MHRLRDADIEQTSSPGMCNVLGDWHGLVPYQRDPKKPNPAAELKELGVAALPQIIAHLDDTRPTRCKGFWRWYWPDSCYLLCYGDCCQQIFESMTGHSVFNRRYSNGYGHMKGFVKFGVVLADYVAAVLVAGVAVAIRIANTSGPDAQASAGMYAFGDRWRPRPRRWLLDNDQRPN
jgi:hypothetical protein